MLIHIQFISCRVKKCKNDILKKIMKNMLRGNIPSKLNDTSKLKLDIFLTISLLSRIQIALHTNQFTLDYRPNYIEF